MSFVNLFKLSIFKSRILWKRHWFLFILEFVIPLILFIPLVCLRNYLVSANSYSRDKQEPFQNGTHWSDQDLIKKFLPQGTHIYYTPNNNFTGALMSEVQKKIDSIVSADGSNTYINLISFKTETEMIEEYHKRYYIDTISPIVFKTADLHTLDYVFKTRFGGLYNRWLDEYANNHEFVLQYVIDLVYVELVTNQPLSVNFSFHLYNQRAPENIEDGIFLLHVFPSITLCTFIILCPTILKSIVEEKKCGVKEYLKMVGMKPYLYYIGWLQHAFITKFVIIVIIVFLMKLLSFNGSTAILEHCSGVLYFIFLLFYTMAAITFIMMLSTFFKRPLIGVALGLLIWVASITPYAAFVEETPKPWLLKMFVGLLPNVALYFGYLEIRNYELRGLGVAFNNFYKSAADYPGDITFLEVLILFAVQTVLYFSLTLYFDNIIPGPYGIPKKFYYPFTELYQFIKSKTLTLSNVTTFTSDPILNQEDAKGQTPAIEINNLHKTYGNTSAVNGLSLEIYEKQITALLGHNGAGKTTTMMIVTGMTRATTGSVKINGLDITTDIDQIRKEIGWCPQHDLLFPYFTIYDHMIYFSLMRGWSLKESEELSNNLLKRMNLYEKRFELASKISGGMKRKLCLCLALTGKNKVLILDEPTSGLDPESRRDVWNILLEERETKSILISTHSMEEADVLSDWVAIMANGTCICYGTPIYLKKKYATGYHLSLLLELNNPHIESFITNIVVSTIKDSYLKHAGASSLVYVLPMCEKDKFPILLKALEDLKMEMPNPEKPIKNMSVNITTLEEVFIRTTDNAVNNSSQESTQGDRPIYRSASVKANIINQVSGLFWKRLWFLKRSWKYHLIFTLIGITIMILVAFFTKNVSLTLPDREDQLKFKLDIYGPTTVYYHADNKSKELGKYYKHLVEDQRSMACEVDSVYEATRVKAHENVLYFARHMVAGASFVNNDITVISFSKARFGGQISLDMIMNAILKMYTGQNNKISTGYSDIPYEHESSDNNKDKSQSVYQAMGVWSIAVPVGMLFIMAQFLIFPNVDNNSKFKTLQYMSGVPPYLYWLVTFLFDFVILYLPMAVLICMVFLINDSFRGTCQLGSLLFFLICYGLPALPCAYFYSYRQTLSCGIALFILLGVVFGPILLGIHIIAWPTREIARGMKYFFLMLFPQFGLSLSGIMFIEKIVLLYNCQFDSTQYAYGPFGNPITCTDCSKIFGSDDDTLLDILVEMIVPFIIHASIVLFFDSVYAKQLIHYIGNLYSLIRGTRENIPPNNSYQNLNENCLFAQEISKYFGAKLVVKNVTFFVEEGKCFGLLGVNGAGKTTTFKMMTRDILSNSGKIGMIEQEERLYTIDITNSKYFKKFGYCPQFNAFNYILSAKELMVVMAQMRNFSRSDSEKIAEDYLDVLDLRKFGSKPSGKYSGGNKRKLSLALALIGCRPYILLDEPTSGVDPVSRRKIWEVIEKLKQVKKVSFVLTSHNMEECEALCENMAIMKDGVIDDAGSVLALKHKHGSGFTVKFKLTSERNVSNIQDVTDNQKTVSSRKRSTSFSTATTGADDGIPMSEHLNPSRLELLKTQMSSLFPCEIKDEHEGLLHYHIEDPQKWSTIFEAVENIKASYNDIVEDYSVSGTTLEDVFLSVAKGLKH